MEHCPVLEDNSKDINLDKCLQEWEGKYCSLNSITLYKLQTQLTRS
jgi:hypothetical protein